MKPWTKCTNEELVIHLELWAALEENLTQRQKEFFEEVTWRLLLSSANTREIGE